MGFNFKIMVSIFRSFGEFLFHLLWLAVAEGLTVEFLRQEIQMIRAKVDEHSADEPESPQTEKFPEYVSSHHIHCQRLDH